MKVKPNLVLASTLLLPLAVLAQTPPPPASGPAPGTTSASALGFSDTTNGPAQVLQRLQLSDAQLPVWADYVARLDAYSKLFYEEKPASAYAAESAVRQFAHLTLTQQNRLAALEDIESVAQRLYAVLSPAQRTVADQMLLGTVPQFGGFSNAPSDSGTRTKREPPGGRHGGGGAGGSGGAGGPGAGIGF